MADDAIGFWLQQAGRIPLLTAAEELHLGTIVRAWQDHPAGPDAAPAAIRRRGVRARDRIVQANLRLVVSITMRIRAGARGRLLEADVPDMLQAGSIGLMRGAERFDPVRGYKFSTFGYWWIRQGISRWVVQSSRQIYIPHPFSDKLSRLGKLGDQLTARLGRSPTVAELAEELGMACADLEALLRVAAPCLSLDAPARNKQHDDAGPLGAIVATDPPEDAPQSLALRARLARLPPHIAGLVADYWGLNGAPLLIGAAAERAGLTVPRAKQMLRQVVEDLRAEMAPPPEPEPPADLESEHQLTLIFP